MDIAVNTNIESVLRREGDHFKGVVLFYYDQGGLHGTFSDFYSFFVRIQELLWMTKEDKELLEKFHPKKQKILKAVTGFLEESQLFGSLKTIAQELNRKSEWSTLSGIFAKYAIPFLKKYKILEILIGGENANDVSEIKKWLQDPNNIVKVIVKRVVSGNQKNLSFLDDGTALWLYYNNIARGIAIKALSSGKVEYFDAVRFGNKPTELFSRRLMINSSGEIDFVKHKYSWKLPIVVHENVREGLPNLYFILDVSGSMESGYTPVLNSRIKLGSRHHYALLGVFGVLKYLQASSLLPRRIALTVFSNETKSEIVSPNNLKSLSSLLFDPMYSGTRLDIREVNKVLDTLGKSVIIMLSDGEIENWDSIVGFMMSVMQQNYSAFLSIESVTEAYYDLRDVCEVFHIRDEKDLANIMINFAAKKYKPYRRVR